MNEIQNSAKTNKYVERYGFLSSARKFDDKYSKILTDTAIKSGKDAVKTASQKVGQKQHKQEDI